MKVKIINNKRNITITDGSIPNSFKLCEFPVSARLYGREILCALTVRRTAKEREYFISFWIPDDAERSDTTAIESMLALIGEQVLMERYLKLKLEGKIQ